MPASSGHAVWWAVLRADKVTIALFGVAGAATVWYFIAGLGESPAWLVAGAASLTGVLRLQRRAIEANKGRPLLRAPVPDDGDRQFSSRARRVLSALMFGGSHPLQPLLFVSGAMAVMGALCATLAAGVSTVDPTGETDFGDVVREAGVLTLATAAAAGSVSGAAIAAIAGTVAIRRTIAAGSDPSIAHPPEAATSQPQGGEACQAVPRGCRNRVLIAAGAAGEVGGVAGGAVAAAVVLLLAAYHPSNAYGPGVHFLVSVAVAAFSSLVASLGVVISPNVRACAEALAEDPRLARRPLRGRER